MEQLQHAISSVSFEQGPKSLGVIFAADRVGEIKGATVIKLSQERGSPITGVLIEIQATGGWFQLGSEGDPLPGTLLEDPAGILVCAMAADGKPVSSMRISAQ